MTDQGAAVESGEGKDSGIKTEAVELKDVFVENIFTANSLAKEALPKAKTLAEFMMLTNAARNLTPSNLEWAKEGNEERNAAEWLSDFIDESAEKRAERETMTMHMLVGELEKNDLSFDPNKVHVVISKINPGGAFSNYRAIAIFPAGKGVGNYDVFRTTDSPRDVIYMELDVACNHAAADQILQDQETAVFEVENLDLFDLHKRLGFDISLGSQQHFALTDEADNITGTRDDKLYILNALKGGFSNETSRYLVSDFNPPAK